MKKSLLILFTIFALSLSGCATWSQVAGSNFRNFYGIEVQLPAGWMRYNFAPGVVITKDGLYLQSIRIQRIAITKKLPHTKKKFSKDMLPQDAAEVELDNVRANEFITAVQVLENQPANIGGADGFKIVYTFRNNDSLPCKVVHYGFLYKKWVYSITYEAALQHYFAKDIADFDIMMSTVRFKK